jgi:hypothetical protein
VHACNHREGTEEAGRGRGGAGLTRERERERDREQNNRGRRGARPGNASKIRERRAEGIICVVGKCDIPVFPYFFHILFNFSPENPTQFFARNIFFSPHIPPRKFPKYVVIQQPRPPLATRHITRHILGNCYK